MIQLPKGLTFDETSFDAKTTRCDEQYSIFTLVLNSFTSSTPGFLVLRRLREKAFPLERSESVIRFERVRNLHKAAILYRKSTFAVIAAADKRN